MIEDMDIKVNKVYKCGKNYVKVISHQGGDIYPYIVIEYNPFADEVLRCPRIGAFDDKGFPSPANTSMMTNELYNCSFIKGPGCIIRLPDDSQYNIVYELPIPGYSFIGVELKETDFPDKPNIKLFNCVGEMCD